MQHLPIFRPYSLLMRIVPFIISTVVTVALVFALNKRWGTIPALGKFLSPQTGFWQNAEASDEGLGEEFVFANLKGKVNVYLDERLVPHGTSQPTVLPNGWNWTDAFRRSPFKQSLPLAKSFGGRR